MLKKIVARIYNCYIVEFQQMSVTRQKQMRISDEGRFLLNACKQGTGYNDTKVTEICYALYCLKLRREVQRAHEFLYNNLVVLTAEQTCHEHDGSKARKAHKGPQTSA